MSFRQRKSKNELFFRLQSVILTLFLIASTECIMAQNVTVSGVVRDETGATLPGAAVVVRGAQRGVTTDIDGLFSIDVKTTDVLEVSFMGYEPVILEIGSNRKFDITLEPQSIKIDEVTVVAFGRQKKESVVSSISTVKVDELRVPASNLTTALAGKIAGIISYQTSGEPGADNAQFFIRGVTTFGYKTSPLILIDGFESTTDDLARLQPDDIESFSVMKDASATVMYGARSANGIISVAT
ncbi:TonB-dependent receptor SusC [bioreactor metagenome]|uniref:TonB-dependent receptor SusC n=1 Tax=bioreactor metagenome TaxID=1076179 RepID=A0A645AB80_9ZZZZ